MKLVCGRCDCLYNCHCICGAKVVAIAKDLMCQNFIPGSEFAEPEKRAEKIMNELKFVNEKLCTDSKIEKLPSTKTTKEVKW